MYHHHHNGKADRFKIRHRYYVNSNIGFMEIKHKNNLDIVKKTRIPHMRSSDTEACRSFISQGTPFTFEALIPTVSSVYNRITIANFEHRERVTIDCNLLFQYQGKTLDTGNLVICEIKKNPGKGKSEFENFLMEKRVKPFSLSKYCMGNYYLNNRVKHNLFKQKAIFINKLINTK